MHIGNLRTALYGYLITKRAGGTFILRIEDTDQNRYVEGAMDIIFNTFNTMGINFDEGPGIGGSHGPYIQSERKDTYLPLAEELIKKGEAYYCFCKKERLEGMQKYDRFCHGNPRVPNDGEPFVVRQFIPDGKTTFHDEVFGDITIDHEEIEDQILIKSDGMPTYNFANVVDDHAMEISHVIRGNEYLTSTPKYQLLYKAFGWDAPVYIHMPLLLSEDGGKISKRKGDFSVKGLLDAGYLPEAIINYIAFLGWSSPDNRELFSLSELTEVFDAKNISKSPASYDQKKLNWMNGEHIKRLPEDMFYEMALPVLKSAIKNPDINLRNIAKMLQSRVQFVHECAEMVDFIDKLPDYSPDLYTHKKMKTTPEVALTALEAILPVYKNTDNWINEVLYAAATECAETLEFKNSQVLWPIRTALSGKPSSPCGASELCVLLGKDETIKRLEIGVNKLK